METVTRTKTTAEGVFVTADSLDARPGITTGTMRFNSPAEAKAFAASVTRA